MKIFLLLLSLFILGLPTSVSAEKHYRLYGSYKALHRVEYDSFTDTRDGQSYKIYKVEKHFSSNRCPGTEYCLDTAFIYMFAENIRYNTPHGVCYVNDCKKYGRYYPREDIEHACPTGWSIPSAEEANIVDYITFDGDTIYGISDRFIRQIHTKDFPADGIKLSDRYARLDDFPSGWFDSKTKTVIHSGKIGTMWTRKEDSYHPSYIDFGLLKFDDMNGLIQHGFMETPGNMYPIKCHKVVFKKPVSEEDVVHRTLDSGIYSMDEF